MCRGGQGTMVVDFYKKVSRKSQEKNNLKK
jgi:hypothetical protein